MPADLKLEGDLAIDSETMGLNLSRDKLCVMQLSNGDGDAHLVQFLDDYSAPNLKALLSNKTTSKIFHYARFDVAAIKRYLDVDLVSPIYCTKIASRLTRTYTDRHGLKDLCKELLNVDLSKQQQSSNWGSEELSEEQIKYAASDVLYLHRIRDRLDEMLKTLDREELAKKCFGFINSRVELDIQGWEEQDIFSHSS